MLTKTVVLLCLAVICAVQGSPTKDEADNEIQQDPLVKVKGGGLRGSTGVSRDGRKYFKFLGIQYGTVPQRFASPKPVATTKWEGIKNATEFGPMCIQMNMKKAGSAEVSGAEDCLNLNVYSPNIKPEEKLPVIVHIYGGGFTMGSACQYVPDFFMDEDVIIVTFNWRQGPLGFLNGQDETATGNQGMKDQVLALKWIQENIESFGGDPQKVTLFGESGSGGVAVHSHIVSPMSKGLFSGAVSMSGTFLSPWKHIIGDQVQTGKKLAHLVGCPTTDPKYMIKCLQNIDPVVLLSRIKNSCEDMLRWDEDEAALQFGPTVDMYSETGDTFLPKEPEELLKAGEFSRVPLVLGATKLEGAIFFASSVVYNDTNRERFNRQWSKLAPKTFMYESTADDTCAVNAQVREYYLSGVDVIDKDSFGNLTDAFGDRVHFQPLKTAANYHSEGGAPTYIYQFALKGDNSIFDFFPGIPKMEGLKGPSFGDDFMYLLETPEFPFPLKKTDRFTMYSKSLIKLWASFAANGVPTDLWGDNKEWPAYDSTSGQPKWLEIDEEPTVKSEDELYGDRLAFWDNLNV